MSVATRVTATGSVSALRSRLISWSIVGGAGSATLDLRNGGRTGTILLTIDVPAGTDKIVQNQVSVQPGWNGIVFPSGIYLAVNGGPVTGATFVYVDD